MQMQQIIRPIIKHHRLVYTVHGFLFPLAKAFIAFLYLGSFYNRQNKKKRVIESSFRAWDRTVCIVGNCGKREAA